MKKRIDFIRAINQPISSRWPKLNLILLLTLVLFQFSFTMYSQNKWGIPFLEKIDLDGIGVEWEDIPSHDFSPSNPGIWEAQGDFTKVEDLQTELKIAWNKKGLCFYVIWKDDFIDEKWIPKDSATIGTPSGRRMDRMYFYDNLKIQIRTEDFNYSSWFAPREDALQWFSLREQKDGKSSSLQTSAPLFKSIPNFPNMYTLEIQYSWDSLHMTPQKTVDLLVIINDTDQKGMAKVKERLGAPRKYISLSTTYNFKR